MKKVITVAMFLLCGQPASAAGDWTPYAVPTEMEVIRDQGVLVIGTFGNPGSSPACTVSGSFFIPISHPQYNALISTVLSAVAGGLSLKAYVSTCTAIGWHGGTFNTLTVNDAIYAKR